ncbi:MAG: hypothetical protein DWQ05_00525 [Calditrichaeota bacterium]|nr:MAG: hypothetical protein DWQ05_00525 [Calditrichota bacterium]
MELGANLISANSLKRDMKLAVEVFIQISVFKIRNLEFLRCLFRFYCSDWQQFFWHQSCKMPIII